MKRASSIISSLKTFSNLNQDDQSSVDLNDLLKTAVRMVEPQVSDKIAITFSGEKLPVIHCYPALLSQVFYNLIQNGVQAIDGEGQIHITSSLKKGVIQVAVTDSGVGIAKENLTRIFDPFFTTKEVGSGTGLGLSGIHDVLKAHQGRITVKSSPGEGATFTVFLPVTTELSS